MYNGVSYFDARERLPFLFNSTINGYHGTGTFLAFVRPNRLSRKGTPQINSGEQKRL